MTAPAATGRWLALVEEADKVRAFVRRDLLTLLSHRGALVTEWVGLLAQLAIFSLLTRMVDPTILPAYGGRQPSYLAFVTVGIGVGAYMHLGLGQVTDAIRQEQLIGTLESVMTAPLALGTLQLGSLAFALIVTPVRILVFLLLAASLFDVELALAGLGPAFAVGLVFLAVMSGVGAVAGALVLTFRRGGGSVTAVAALATAASGAYFPLDLLPGWLQPVLAHNPIALAIEGMRVALLGDGGWTAVTPHLAWLSVMAVPSLAAGRLVFRWAMRREVRDGGLGLY